MPNISVVKTNSAAIIENLPTGNGLVLYSLSTTEIGYPTEIETGLSVEIPTGWEAQFYVHKDLTSENNFLIINPPLQAGISDLNFKIVSLNPDSVNVRASEVPLATLVFRSIETVTIVDDT